MSGDHPPKTTDPSDPEGVGEDFLRRWSRRKDRDRSGGLESGDPPSRSSVSTEPGADLAPEIADTPADEVLTDADMPPLETLDERSDYSGFFSSGVSEKLRRAALRKLFRSPVFNVVDGLDDYDEDFRTFEALGDIVTSDMRERVEREAERDDAAKPAGRAGTRENAPEASPASDAEPVRVGEAESDEEPGGASPALDAEPADGGSVVDAEDDASAAPDAEEKRAGQDARSSGPDRSERIG